MRVHISYEYYVQTTHFSCTFSFTVAKHFSVCCNAVALFLVVHPADFILNFGKFDSFDCFATARTNFSPLNECLPKYYIVECS